MIGLGSITQKQLRTDAISYIQNLGQEEQNKIAGFLTTDLDTYLQNMEKDGAYGDHIIIDAIARHLGCIIQIVQGSDNDIKIGDSDASQRLVIGYLSDSKQHCLSLGIRSIQPGDFVSVYLSLKKKRHFYVAKVTEVDNSEARLRFLKPNTPSSNVYVWAIPTDINWVATNSLQTVASK